MNFNDKATNLGTVETRFNMGNQQGSGDFYQCCVTAPPTPDLTITKTHVGNFTQGDTGKQYTITVTNNGTGATSGMVSVSDTVPSGLTTTGISGTNWNCTQPSRPYRHSDALGSR